MNSGWVGAAHKLKLTQYNKTMKMPQANGAVDKIGGVGVQGLKKEKDVKRERY